jgi:hypothetical protein
MLRRRFVLVSAVFVLSGCASFDGRPTPVITVQRADAMVASYPADQAIEHMGVIAASDVAARNTYRNRVVAAYLTAIDAHYGQFVRDLSRSGKGAHLGFDTILLGLTGAGAIFDKAASELASGATAIAGVRNSFDRELFAEKALPIIMSLMESRRLEVRSDISRGLSRPEGVYTLEDAFSDLMRYEAAGTIDGALNDAAADAGDRADEAQYDFSKAKDLCVVDAATDTKRRGLMIALEKFERDAESAAVAGVAAQNRQSIQQAAQALGIDASIAPADKEAAFRLLAAMRDQIEAQCDGAGVDALRAKITAAGVTLT